MFASNDLFSGFKELVSFGFDGVLQIQNLLFLSGKTDAYDALDPSGNITIKWDVMQWTPDGYVVSRMNSHLANPMQL